MSSPRIGSLCTGVAGLDLAAASVFGGTAAWFAETDPHASRVLAHHFSEVPNLGDITAPGSSKKGGPLETLAVDVITAGFP